MGLLLLAACTYLGIMACIYTVSSAYESGGVLGLLSIVVCVGIGLWIADADYKKRK